MHCPPVRGDNPRALANGLSPVQADKLYYNCFISPLLVQTLSIAKYFVLELGFSDKNGIIWCFTILYFGV